ncbi:glycosyltransferase family 4 protein [Intrasporangium chromatireducens]|uniref:glycosyltransferase family 4 protein n=1 Tax=Intrasporangium chromatireducens TaxID=1386088 RepID=UPI0012DF9C9D|nr:glycosyltransferase family 4 protein [Intrasporangium chromatireducens]
MMRIGLINHYAVPPTTAGGTRHWDLAKAWDEAGHHVVILASSFNHFAQTTEARLAVRTPIGRRSSLLTLNSRSYEGNGIARAIGMFGFAWRVVRSRRLLAGVDVIIGSSPHPFAAVAAALVARLRGVPFVYEIRDLWPQTLIDMGAMRARSIGTRLLYRVERWTVGSARGVVYVPPRADRYLEEKGLLTPAALHAPNSAPRFDGPSGAPASRLGEVLARVQELQKNGYRVFCYAGTIGRANGLGPVVEAFLDPKVRGQAVLVICGDGPERSGLEARVPHDGNVIFVGHVPKVDAFRIIHRADVALFHLLDAPVFRYGLSPNKIVDYLAIGKPILYAGPSVPNPTTGSGASLDASPGIPESIADAVQRFIEMTDEQLRDMAKRAHRHAAENYSTEAVAQKYARFLEEVIAEAHRCSEPVPSGTATNSIDFD